MTLHLLQYESGFAYFIRNTSSSSDAYSIWIGRAETKNLQVVREDTSNGKLDLLSGEDSQVECLQIVDISERSHFHIIVRSKSASGDGHAVELKGTENLLTAGD